MDREYELDSDQLGKCLACPKCNEKENLIIKKYSYRGDDWDDGKEQNNDTI